MLLWVCYMLKKSLEKGLWDIHIHKSGLEKELWDVHIHKSGLEKGLWDVHIAKKPSLVYEYHINPFLNSFCVCKLLINTLQGYLKLFMKVQRIINRCKGYVNPLSTSVLYEVHFFKVLNFWITTRRKNVSRCYLLYDIDETSAHAST